MKPRTISATSVESYVGCPKRFLAELKRVYTTPGGPSAFGTAIHATLDKYIENTFDAEGRPRVTEHDLDLLLTIWEAASAVYLGWGNDYEDEGREMLINWAATRRLPQKVVSREIKNYFDLEVPDTGGGIQKVTYICDRVDEIDGVLEVIDYKTQWENLDPSKMRRLIQPPLYALAMRKQYGVEQVAVTFDLTRYSPVTVIYNSREMDRFERYLGEVTKRMWEEENPKEQVNKGCKYCVRKGICGSLARAAEHSMPTTLDVVELAALKQTAKDAGKAFENLIAEIDEVLLHTMRVEDTDLIDTGDHTVKANIKTYTDYSPEVVHRVLGDDALSYMKVQKGALDKALKDKTGRFSPAQAAEIWDLANKSYGNPTIEVTPTGRTA